MKNGAKGQHRHYWHYPWVVWDGGPLDRDSTGRIVVARYCRCGEIQQATAKVWRRANPKTHPDLLQVCQQRLLECTPGTRRL